MTKLFFPFSLTLVLLLILQGSFTRAQSSAAPPAPDPNAPKIKWMSFEEAYALNKKKPRKVFIDMYTDWCGWCKRMDATTFADPVIVAYMNEHFYSVKMDAERKDTIVLDGVTFVNQHPENKRSSHQLAIELLRGKMSYPSFVFLNDKSQMLTVVAGYQPAKEFEPIIHYFGDDAYLKSSWEEFKPGFKGKVP